MVSVIVPPEAPRLVRVSEVTPAPKPTAPPETVRAPEVPRAAVLLRTNVPLVTVVEPL